MVQNPLQKKLLQNAQTFRLKLFQTSIQKRIQAVAANIDLVILHNHKIKSSAYSWCFFAVLIVRREDKKMSVKNITVVVVMVAILLNLTPSSVFAKETENSKFISEDFKVVGYYSGDLFNESVDKLQTDKLTHIMYAFLIPNDDGTVKALKKPEQLAQVVTKAHMDGAKVYIALGGWSYDGVPIVSTFEKVAADNQLRGKLVQSVVDFVLQNELDGVEIDWEHPNATSIGDYEKLVVDLSMALNKEEKKLTAAVNGAWSTTAGPEVSMLMTDKCLNAFEFISVMGYDMNNSEHSPLWFGNTSIDYWLNRGVQAEKIVLGMPLYARPSWMQYRHLVALEPENAYKDYVEMTTNNSYYNGLNTLREKTTIALKKAGGVMVFDVNEDVDWQDEKLGKYSVVSMIDDTIQSVNGYNKSELEKYIAVILDQQILKFSAADGYGMPFVDDNNRILMPMRKLLEAVGAEISYDNETKTVTATKTQDMAVADNEEGSIAGQVTEVKVIIGESYITVDRKHIDMDTQAIIKDNRTYLPARAILEAFGYELKWSQISRTVYASK
jgi:GH18 family chitinase